MGSIIHQDYDQDLAQDGWGEWCFYINYLPRRQPRRQPKTKHEKGPKTTHRERAPDSPVSNKTRPKKENKKDTPIKICLSERLAMQIFPALFFFSLS